MLLKSLSDEQLDAAAYSYSYHLQHAVPEEIADTFWGDENV
jgi:hypothetical protein